jgi:hypothetical protein
MVLFSPKPLAGMCKISPPKNKESVGLAEAFFSFFSAAKFRGKEGGVGHEKGNILSHIPFVFG